MVSKPSAFIRVLFSCDYVELENKKIEGFPINKFSLTKNYPIISKT